MAHALAQIESLEKIKSPQSPTTLLEELSCIEGRQVRMSYARK